MSFKNVMDDFLSDVKQLSFSSQLPGSSKNTKPEDGNNMKIKLLEAWNNFRFEISDGTQLKKDSPLWILGKCYHIEQIEETLTATNYNTDKDKSNKHSRPAHINMFMLDYSSKLWFTYRKGFPPLSDTTLTSDTGWGCMIRTAQMMIGQSLVTHFLGRDWNWLSMQPGDLKAIKQHRDIIQWFIDEPNPRCPFSIHRLTDIGLNYQCKPGNWYGPGTMAYIMQDAMECGKGVNEQLIELVVYVAQDCTVYTSDVKEMCRWGQFSTTTDTEKIKSHSVIILIPVRLGEATVNPIYADCLESLLTLNQSVGIIGGKPKHSLYFVGFQDDYLIYLDPHYCQPADNLASFSNKRSETYHNLSVRKTHISKLDPSCCFGFYCRNEKDFDQFVIEAKKVLSPPKQKLSYPICLILDGSLKDFRLKQLAENKIYCEASPNDDNVGFTEYELNSNLQSIDNEQPVVVGSSDETLGSSECKHSMHEDNEEKPSSSKIDKFNLSLSNTKQRLTKFYRQRSHSPKPPIEEEFEFL